MTTETKEWIHLTSCRLIEEMSKRLNEQSILTPEDEAWVEDAENWLSYQEQHYN